MSKMAEDMRRERVAKESDAAGVALAAADAAAGKAVWKSLVRCFERDLAKFLSNKRPGTISIDDVEKAASSIFGGLLRALHGKVVDGLADGTAPLHILNKTDGTLASGAQLGRGRFRVELRTSAVVEEDWARSYLLDGLRVGRLLLMWHPRASGTRAREATGAKLRRDEKTYRNVLSGAILLCRRTDGERERFESGEMFAAQPAVMEPHLVAGEVEVVQAAEKAAEKKGG